MTEAEILKNYLAAYNLKRELEADPLMEDGAFTDETDKITGDILITQLEQLNDMESEVTSQIEAQIAEQEEIIIELGPLIKEIFTKYAGLESVRMETGQTISVGDADVII